MTTHAKDALRRARITQILNLPLAIATAEAAGAESLIASKDGQIFDFVTACIAAVGAVVANERAIAEQEKVGIGVEQSAACVTAEAVDVPSVTGYEEVRRLRGMLAGVAVTYQAQRLCPPPISARACVSQHVPYQV